MASLRTQAAAPERDVIDELRERRAVKLMNACDLTDEQVRRLARGVGLSPTELRARAKTDAE